MFYVLAFCYILLEDIVARHKNHVYDDECCVSGHTDDLDSPKVRQSQQQPINTRPVSRASCSSSIQERPTRKSEKRLSTVKETKDSTETESSATAEQESSNAVTTTNKRSKKLTTEAKSSKPPPVPRRQDISHSDKQSTDSDEESVDDQETDRMLGSSKKTSRQDKHMKKSSSYRLNRLKPYETRSHQQQKESEISRPHRRTTSAESSKRKADITDRANLSNVKAVRYTRATSYEQAQDNLLPPVNEGSKSKLNGKFVKETSPSKSSTNIIWVGVSNRWYSSSSSIPPISAKENADNTDNENLSSEDEQMSQTDDRNSSINQPTVPKRQQKLSVETLRRRARFRWHFLYTIIHNHQLLDLRKGLMSRLAHLHLNTSRLLNQQMSQAQPDEG